MASDNWTDEECRYFFKLYAEEKGKGNKTKVGMNQTAKENIINKFETRFGRGYTTWEKFRNKYDTSRKVYTKYKKLLEGRSGLGYTEMGHLQMTDNWWDERKKEWPGFVSYKSKPLANMDLFRDEFRGVSVTRGEGWSAQTGEQSLDSRVDGINNEDEVESVDKELPLPETQTQAGETQTQSGSLRKRKRKEKDIVIETSVARNKVLEEKNQIAQQMLQREYASSVERVIEILNGLPEVRKWSPFYQASIVYLMADAVNRQGFVAFSSDDDKIRYLELMTGKSYMIEFCYVGSFSTSL